jgi:hypothetical protein
VLEASYIVFMIQPHHLNFSKRLVKSPKLYFVDTGLACSLLGIDSPDQLASHYLRGSLFENFILSELMKSRLNRGIRPNLYFWRDNKGTEIDCIIEGGNDLAALEIKSGNTFDPDYFRNIRYWNRLSGSKAGRSFVVYGGESQAETKDGTLAGWKDIDKLPL